MYSELSQRNRLWLGAVLLLLMLGIAACDTESDDSPGVAAVENSVSVPADDTDTTDSTATNTTQPVASMASVPISESDTTLQGRLAVVRGATLEVYDLAAPSEPTTLAEDVNAPTLQLISTANRVFFTAGFPRKRLHELSFTEEMVVSQVVRVPSEFSTPISVSPNGDWVVVTGFPTTEVGRTDGSNERYTLIPQGEFGFTFWLEDNRLLVLKNAQTNPQQFSGTVQNLEDRALNEELAPSILDDILALTINSETPSDILRLNDLVFDNFGSRLAYVPQNVEDVETDLDLQAPAGVGNAAFTGNLPLCDPWELRRVLPDGTPELLYSVPDALFLTNPYQMADGTVYVEHWYLEDCDTEQRFVDLVRINPDGTTDVLIADMNPSSGQSYGSWLLRVANRTQLSPDGSMIAWLDGSEADGYTSVNILVLATGQNYELARTQLTNANLSVFFEQEAFKAVQWLPDSSTSPVS